MHLLSHLYVNYHVDKRNIKESDQFQNLCNFQWRIVSLYSNTHAEGSLLVGWPVTGIYYHPRQEGYEISNVKTWDKVLIRAYQKSVARVLRRYRNANSPASPRLVSFLYTHWRLSPCLGADERTRRESWDVQLSSTQTICFSRPPGAIYSRISHAFYVLFVSSSRAWGNNRNVIFMPLSGLNRGEWLLRVSAN